MDDVSIAEYLPFHVITKHRSNKFHKGARHIVFLKIFQKQARDVFQSSWIFLKTLYMNQVSFTDLWPVACHTRYVRNKRVLMAFQDQTIKDESW